MPVKQLPCLVTNSWVRNGIQTHLVPFWVVNGSRGGEAVAGWRKKIKAGVSAGSPYSVDRLVQVDHSPASPLLNRKLVGTAGSAFYTIAEDSWAYNGYMTDLPSGGVSQFDHLIGVSPSAEAEALGKVYAKIRNDAYNANGLLFLGELRETIHMLRHPLESARKASKNYLDRLKSERSKAGTLKRRKSENDVDFRKRKLTAVKDGMSGSWLELQFGIRPAVSDAKEICGAILDTLNGEARKSRVRGKSAGLVKAESFSTFVDPITCLRARVNRFTHTEAGVQYVVGLKHSLEGPGSLTGEMYRRLGFQVQNFIPTIYELVPYSFLIDYFVNLGGIIEAVCTDTTGVYFVSKTVKQLTTVSVSEHFSAWDESWTNGTWHPISLNGELFGYRNYRHVTITRTIPTSLPIPPLVVSVPGTDSLKWVNMGALLASARDFRFRR